GGGGEKRTLRLVAEYADEWNITPTTRDVYDHKLEVLKQHCDDVGRDVSTIKRSIMLGHLIGRTDDELRQRASVFKEVFAAMADLEPDEIISRYRERGMLVGTPA